MKSLLKKNKTSVMMGHHWPLGKFLDGGHLEMAMETRFSNSGRSGGWGVGVRIVLAAASHREHHCWKRRSSRGMNHCKEPGKMSLSSSGKYQSEKEITLNVCVFLEYDIKAADISYYLPPAKALPFAAPNVEQATRIGMLQAITPYNRFARVC